MAASIAIPSLLQEALEQRRLAILCGAGVSIAAPSNLPSWWGFNNLMLQEIKVIAFPLIPDEARPAFAELALEHPLSVPAFSDKVVRSFAGSSYFPVLEVLESEKPNANHSAMAELARQGTLRAILSTNFDTLIERAFREIAVSLRVLADARDATAGGYFPGPCTLLKVHGSVTAATSLVDTVGQKVRGIHSVVKDRICDLLEGNHLLVLGFSGADLAFGNDYLALSAAKDGITWLHRPGNPPGLEAQRIVALAGKKGMFLEGQLPDFFQLLGIELAPHEQGGDPESDRQRAEELARDRIRAWLQKPHIGSFAAATFCATLLDSIGNRSAARAIRQSLAAYIEGQKELPLTVGVIFRNLTLEAIKDGSTDEAIRWAEHEQAYWTTLINLQGDQITPEAWKESLIGLASTTINISAAHRSANELDAANRELEKAMQLAEKAGDLALLSRIAISQASLAQKAGEGLERVLDLARRARALGQAGEQVNTLLEADLLEADTLAELAEYDRAWEVLERARPLSEWEGTQESHFELQRQAAELELRRGKLDSAYGIAHSLLAKVELHGLPGTSTQISWWFCWTFGFHSPLRKEISERLQLLIRLREVGGPETFRIPTLQLLQRYNKALQAGEVPSVPKFISLQSKEDSDPETQLRQAIIRLEYKGDAEKLPHLFDLLCSHARNRPQRLLDLAICYRLASERIGDFGDIAKALNSIGIAHSLLGDPGAAEKAFLDALSLALPPTGHLEAEIWRYLAVARSLQGKDEEVEELARRAEDRFLTIGDFEDAARTRIDFAQHHARRGNMGKVFEEAGAALAMSKAHGLHHIQHAIEKLLAEWRTGLSTEEPADTSSPNEIGVAWPGEIANRGIADLLGGRLEQGKAQILEAMQLYEKSGDMLGVSRCLNNLAEAAGRENKWDEAIELVQKALSIRRSLGDDDGEILTLSNLAMYSFYAGRYQEARNFARSCVALAGGSSPSRSLLVAWVALAFSAAEIEIPEEAVDAAQRAIALFPVLNVPDLEPLVPDLQRIADAGRWPTQLERPKESEFEGALTEAERLRRSSRFEESLSLINALPLGLTDRETAQLMGTRGNVLQSAGQHNEAILEFERAATAFRKIRLTELAIMADRNRAVSLRQLGRREEAEQVLRTLIGELPPGRQRADAINSLVNVLVEGQGQTDPNRIAEARQLLEEALGHPGLEDELHGLLEMMKGQLAFVGGDLEAARIVFQKARRLLLRSNSKYLGTLEAVLRHFEEAGRQSANDTPAV